MSELLTLPPPASPAPLVLRPYQHQALDAIQAATLRGVRRQVVALPTGAGKTVIFAHLIAQMQQRTLIIVHRDELIRQTLDKLQMVQVAGQIGVVKAQADAHNGDVVVASVQTLSRPQRLARVAPTFRLIIVDEAHHALCENTYGQVLERLGAWQPDGPLVVGFTATPFRPNNDPLITTDDVRGCFDEVVFALPLPWMIEHGYLAPLVPHGIFIEGLNLDKVRTRHGDYSAEDLSQALITADTPEHLVRGYREITPGRRALIFCPTVAMTYAVEHAFARAGIRAASVVGDTPVEERQAIYRQVREGAVRALCNCMVLTEGFDEPSIDAIFMARPTKSKVLYTQCIGRGLRLWPGKEDCIVVDAVGATKRHDLLSVAALLGLLKPKGPGHAEEPLGQGVDEGEERQTGYHAHKLDLLDRDPLHWVVTPKGYWVVSMGPQMVRIRANGQGAYRLEARTREARAYTVIADHLTQEYCLGIAAHTAKDAHLEHLVRRGAGWRQKPRTAPQEALARKLGITIAEDWTAGELSDAITRITGEWYDRL
jgi:superfamily II DNA or RNA helicase